jgi:type IV secretion system protein TrbL
MVARIALVAFGLLASASSVAHAQIDNAGVLDQALKRYRDAAQGWQDAAHGAASSLFWSLATISLVWTMGQLALRRAEVGEFFGELVRFLLFTGFWAWMLENGPQHAQMIVDSMVRLGGSAAFTSLKSPSGVVDIGFQLLDLALGQSSIQDPISTTIGVLMALGVLIILALVGVNMLVALISCWVVAYAGLFILGFGGSKWTSDMAINYYRMILSLGLQVFAMILLVGVGDEMLRDYFGRLEQTVNARELAVVLVIALVLLSLVNRVPALIGTLANGSSPQYALGSGAGASAALSTLSAATGIAAWSTKAAVGTTKGAYKVGVATGKGAWGGAKGAYAAGSAAYGAIADSFRSGSSKEAASSGSVFAPPPPLASTADVGREGSSASGNSRDGSSSDASGSSARSNEPPMGPASSSSADADRAARSGAAPASRDTAEAARDAAAVPAKAVDSAGDARASSDNANVNGGNSRSAGAEGGGALATGTQTDATQAATSSGTRGLRSAAAPASDGAGAGRTATSPDAADQRPHEPGTSVRSPGAAGSPANAIMQASSLPASVSPSSTATSAPSSALLAAAAQPGAMQASERFQSLAPPPPLGAFPSRPREAAPLLGTAPQSPVASSSRGLLAATQGQTTVDVEAEVAAFRDQES